MIPEIRIDWEWFYYDQRVAKYGENGRSWQITEDALIGPEGQEALRLGGHLAYWFGWYAFFPNTLVYEGKVAE